MTTMANMSSSIVNISHSVLSYVYDAVVFIDDASAEVVHWSLGAGKLFESGARNLKKLSSFENGGEGDEKAVFIVNDLLLDTSEQVIYDIISSSHFKYCTVITSVSHSLHQHLAGTGSETQGTEAEGNVFFREFETKLVEWMHKKDCHAEVVHIPFSFASVCSSLFFIPAFADLWPLLSSDVKRITETTTLVGTEKEVHSVDDLTLDLLPENRQRAIKKLVSTLSSLCEELEVNEDVYCLGSTSRIIGTELAGLLSAKARRKAAPKKASLILVDRTLDMTGACGHHHESFLDRVLSLLPPLPGHTADVALDMSAFFSSHGDSDFGIIPPGCLSHPQSSSSRELLSQLITSRKQTNALMEVNRNLVETIAKAKLPVGASKIGRVTADSLNDKLQLFRNNQDVLAKHGDIVQLTTACVQTLSHPCLAHQEELASKEKLLVQMLGDDVDEVVWRHMMNLMTEEINKQEPGLSGEEILLLWTLVASLTGDSLSWIQGNKEDLKTKLMQVLKKDQKTSDFMGDLVSDGSEDGLSSCADLVISGLEGLSKARTKLQELGDLLDTGSGTKPPSYSPLLQQLMNAIFDPNQPELVDLEYKSSGIRDLLKSGFRLFMNVAKPRPSDNPLLIVFVVGGVTCSEVKLIKETVNAKSPNTQVIVGGTQVAKPENLLRSLFIEDHLRPR